MGGFDEYMKTADPGYQPSSSQQGQKEESGLSQSSSSLMRGAQQSGRTAVSSLKDKDDLLGSSSILDDTTDDISSRKASMSASYTLVSKVFVRLIHAVRVFGPPTCGRLMTCSVCLGICAQLITAFCAVAPVYVLVKMLADSAKVSEHSLLWLAGILACAVLLRGVLGYAEQYLQHVLAFSAVRHLRPQLLSACHYLAPHHLEGADPSRALSLVTSDIGSIEELFARSSTSLISAACSCVVMDLLLVAWQHPFIALGTLVVQVSIAIIIPALWLPLTRQTMLQSTFELDALNAALLDRMQGIREVMIAGFGGRMQEEMQTFAQKILTARTRESQVRMKVLDSIDMLVHAALGIMSLLVVLWAPSQTMSTSIILVVLLCFASFSPCIQVAGVFGTMVRGLDAADRLEDLLNRANDKRVAAEQVSIQASGRRSEEAVNQTAGRTLARNGMSDGSASSQILQEHSLATDSASSDEMSWCVSSVVGATISDRSLVETSPLKDMSIDLIDLWFAYPHESSVDLPPEIIAAMEAAAELTLPPGHPPISKRLKRDNSYVLQMASTHIKPGCITGIKGQSGAGKSTLAQLLLGLYQPTAGILRIGQVPLTLQTEEILRSQVAYLSQDTHLFVGTLRSNLLIANPHASHDELVDCLQRVGLGALVCRLDDAIDGVAALLSDGERQRIGVARCMLSHRPFVVLDEPTSHLDTIAEAQVLQAIMQLSSHATIVLISHRASTLQICDEICLLRDGFLFEELS